MKASSIRPVSASRPPEPTLWKRGLMRLVMRALFYSLCRIEVSGIGNLAAVKGAILAINHLSYLDAPLIFMLVRRNKLSGMAATKYQEHWLFSWIVNVVDGIWLNREDLDVDALRAARAYLQGGWLLGIAPEGTRSRSNVLIPAKTGVAFLADKAGTPVIPVAITGTETALPKLRHFRRPHLTVQFGRPLHLLPVARQTREADLRRNTDEIMCQIAAMLPEAYRGAYAGHPRLVEIVAGQP